MSRKTNIPPKIILGDRGIQTYRSCAKGFTDSMRITTFKESKNAAGDSRIVRESEFAKPYGEQYEDPPEDFSAMEYEVPRWPPWGWDFPGMEDPASGWHVTFLCGGDYCYCPDANKDFAGGCGWRIIGAEFIPPWPAVRVQFSDTSLLFTAIESASGCGNLTITMKARFKVGEKYQTVVGTHSNILVCECIEADCEEEEVGPCDDTGIAWDYTLSPATIARNTSATVYITDSLGTGGPYTWSVAGSGTWSLDNVTTSGLTNTLNCGADACGTAIITVTGCDVTVITGEVRCTTGGWSGWYDTCGPGSNPGCGLNTWCMVQTGGVEIQVTCGCCIDCQPPTAHPCAIPPFCVPAHPSFWNQHCQYGSCGSVCIDPQYITRHHTQQRDWEC